MSQQYQDQLAKVHMTETWEQWVGQSVNGKFCLRRYLGGSEHSAVFLTDYDDREPQSAAIKLIAENAPDAERQLDSWRLAATVLSHPHLIQLFQAGRCKIGDVKLVYVVMERADEDLSQIIPQRALTETEATDMLKPALDVLAYIHAKGSVHGRIKPANIMACGDQLKLSSDGLRRTGDPIIGRGPYGPPEAVASPAGDVWSLAMTMVEALTQHVPAWDRNAPGNAVVPDTLPAPLLDIARHCLHSDPNQRWTIADITSRLDPTAALPPPRQQLLEPVASPASPRYLIPAVLVLLLMVAAVIGLKVLNREPKTQAESAAAIEKSAPTTLPEPRPAENTAASEKDEATSNEQKNLGDVPAAAAPIQPTAPEKAPATAPSSQDVIHRVIPDASQSALDTIRGTVRVSIRAHVNPSGDVSEVAIDSPGPSRYFARLAQQAAQQWKFSPNGTTSDWILRFEFTATGAKAFSAHAAP
jgi:TonB family protein